MDGERLYTDFLITRLPTWGDLQLGWTTLLLVGANALLTLGMAVAMRRLLRRLQTPLPRPATGFFGQDADLITIRYRDPQDR